MATIGVAVSIRGPYSVGSKSAVGLPAVSLSTNGTAGEGLETESGCPTSDSDLSFPEIDQ